MKPNEPAAPRSDERKTVDLCGEEKRGVRCVRERGHAGPHECPRWSGHEPIRWD
jgi:hypothetical protein